MAFRSLLGEPPPSTLLQRLRSYWPYRSAEPLPPLSTSFAASTSLVFTILYVLPFYLTAASRPSRALSRDDPSVIRARIRSVYVSCSLCTFAAFYILSVHAHLPLGEILRLLGWYPVSFSAIGRSIFLAVLLFLGPLFERLVIEDNWRFYLDGQSFFRELGSWVGWRNYVVGPVSEELIFRSLLIPINLLSPQVLGRTAKGTHAGRIILTTPLFFGLAHLHHLYEFRLLHPQASWSISIAQTVLQFAYTTLFGWFAAFLFVRTGSMWAAILVHSFCNWMGLPRLWGRVERPTVRVLDRLVVQTPARDPLNTSGGGRSRSGSYIRLRKQSEDTQKPAVIEHVVAWTVAYYLLLLTGLFLFWKGFWILSDNESQLASI